MLLRDYLRNLLLAKIEIQYYLQPVSIFQLERVLLESKLFKKNEIAEVAEQLNCSPGQALATCWGYSQLQHLEHTCRAKSGPQFSFAVFLHHLLAQGPIPFELIQHNMVKQLINKNDK
jgi:uncharacterized protein (DUF885 family)